MEVLHVLCLSGSETSSTSTILSSNGGVCAIPFGSHWCLRVPKEGTTSVSGLRTLPSNLLGVPTVLEEFVVVSKVSMSTPSGYRRSPVRDPTEESNL